MDLSCLWSPVKFSPGDFWGRGPSASVTNPQTPVEYPMETGGIEQMDVTVCGEASAPLPIRQPNTGPYKKQAFPMISKRPEHLRMNLWHNWWQISSKPSWQWKEEMAYLCRQPPPHPSEAGGLLVASFSEQQCRGGSLRKVDWEREAKSHGSFPPPFFPFSESMVHKKKERTWIKMVL